MALLERAIQGSPEAPDRRRALQEMALADAHYFLGDLTHSRALLEQALERLGYPSRRGRVATGRDVAHTLALRLAPSAIRRPTRDPELADLLREASNAMRRLVQIGYLYGSSPLETARLAVTSLDLAERSGPSPELARALANASVLASLAGLRGLAGRYARRACTMAERAEHAAASAYVWNVTAILRVGEGAWTDAVAASDRALLCFGTVGDYNLESELWQTRAAIELSRGSLGARRNRLASHAAAGGANRERDEPLPLAAR